MWDLNPLHQIHNLTCNPYTNATPKLAHAGILMSNCGGLVEKRRIELPTVSVQKRLATLVHASPFKEIGACGRT